MKLKIMLRFLMEFSCVHRGQINVTQPQRYQINITHPHKDKIYYVASWRSDNVKCSLSRGEKTSYRTENNSNKAVCTEGDKKFKIAVILKWAVTVRILKKMLWVGVYRTSACYILYVRLWVGVYRTIAGYILYVRLWVGVYWTIACYILYVRLWVGVY